MITLNKGDLGLKKPRRRKKIIMISNQSKLNPNESRWWNNIWILKVFTQIGSIMKLLFKSDLTIKLINDFEWKACEGIGHKNTLRTVNIDFVYDKKTECINTKRQGTWQTKVRPKWRRSSEPKKKLTKRWNLVNLAFYANFVKKIAKN